MKRKDSDSSGTNGRGFAEPGIIAIADITTHPTFLTLLAISEELIENVIQDIQIYGYYASEPITLAQWPGLQEPVLIDGHLRVRAALEAGITHVPYVLLHFESELAAVDHVLNLQTKRRPTDDAVLYRLCERFDRLNARGGDRRSPASKSKGTRVPFDPGQGKSAERIAQSLGCNYKKVQKIRKIIKDGTPEIQRAVRTGRMSINRAYTLIRQMEKGKANSAEHSEAARVMEVKILFSEETVTILRGLGGNLGDHINKAVTMYIRSFEKTETVEESDEA